MRHAHADDFTLIEDLFIFHIRMQYSKALGYGKEHRRAVAREDLRTILAFAKLIVAGILLSATAHAQSLIVGTPTIIRANYSVVFNLQSTTTPITALQFTLNFVPGQVTSVTALNGSAGVAAGKTVQCGALNTTVGLITCIVSGLNTTAIGTGTVANFTSTVSENTLFTQIVISLTCLVASDANGNPVPFTNPPGCNNEVQSFNPDGVTTSFTLQHTNVANVVVTINGVVQTGYAVSNGTLIFTVAPPCPQPTCAAITVSYTYALSTPANCGQFVASTDLATLSGTPQPGDLITITVIGAHFTYIVATGDSLTQVVNGLVAAIAAPQSPITSAAIAGTSTLVLASLPNGPPGNVYSVAGSTVLTPGSTLGIAFTTPTFLSGGSIPCVQ